MNILDFKINTETQDFIDGFEAGALARLLMSGDVTEYPVTKAVLPVVGRICQRLERIIKTTETEDPNYILITTYSVNLN